MIFAVVWKVTSTLLFCNLLYDHLYVEIEEMEVWGVGKNIFNICQVSSTIIP